LMPEIKSSNKVFMKSFSTFIIASVIWMATSTVLVAKEKAVSENDLKNGDLLFQSMNCGAVCEQIEKSLQTPYSHLGLI
jgi:hypothetical protein